METQNNLKLTGKRVIIMGGSSGIGLAIARLAASEGAAVIIVSSSKQRVDDALSQLPPGSEGYGVDLSAEDNIRQFFNQIGRFDHLVYTAGENISLGNMAETSPEDAKRFFNVRYWGAFAAVKYAADQINADGSIVLTGGIAGARPGKGWGVAASICCAMEGFTRAMAVELAPVRVNLVAPGVVKTNLWNSLPQADREGLYTNVGNMLPVGRVGEPEDIAPAYLYLMTQRYGTGQCLVVDGGNVLV